jgi:hypothetical protein
LNCSAKILQEKINWRDTHTSKQHQTKQVPDLQVLENSWISLNDTLSSALPQLLMRYRADERYSLDLMELVNCYEISSNNGKSFNAFMKIILEVIEHTQDNTLCTTSISILRKWALTDPKRHKSIYQGLSTLSERFADRIAESFNSININEVTPNKKNKNTKHQKSGSKESSVSERLIIIFA